MTADVYAGDDFARVDSCSVSDSFLIRLTADAQPDVLLRIASQLAFLNCAPSRVLLQRQANETVIVSIVLAGCAPSSVELARRKLEQLTCVTSVELGRHEPGSVTSL